MFKIPIIYVFAVIILGLAVALRISWSRPVQKLPKSGLITFLVTVKVEPKISGKWQVIEAAGSRIYVDLFPRYKVGDQLKVQGEIDEWGNIFYPKVEKISQLQVGGLKKVMVDARGKLYKNISQLLPAREATLVSGTVLGVDDIDRAFRDQLIKTGTIHVVVVSGQNLMIVAGVFLSMAKFLGRRQSLALATVVAVLYAFLTGLEPPVVRATLMVLASTLAIYFGRESWPLWNLILAALLIVFVWPKALFEVSFQLTFAATLGIMTLGGYLVRAVGPAGRHPNPTVSLVLSPASPTPTLDPDSKKELSLGARRGRPGAPITHIIRTSIINNAAIAVSAYLFTAPIILFYFGRLSAIAPLVNILVIEAVFPIMILGFLIATLSLILMPLAQILAYFAYVPAFYFVKVVEIFAKLPIEPVSLGKGNWAVVVGFYVLLVILIFVWTRRSSSQR